MTFPLVFLNGLLAADAAAAPSSLQNLTEIAGQLLPGFGATLLIFILTLVLSLPLGLLVAFGRMSKMKLIRYPVQAVISVLRGTPLMLQLLVVFFGPYWIFGIPLTEFFPYSLDMGFFTLDYRFVAVIIGFSVNYAAYFAEIYRGGIEAISQGQHEAGAVLGFTKAQTFVYIILPQVFRNILPGITNEVVTLVKDTSLAYTLSFAEMYMTASKIASYRANITPIFVAGLFYYVTNFLVQLAMGKMEKRLDYYKR